MILACNNISKSFGTVEVLKDVSFHINDREKAAIVGVNGCGKSTLLKIIIGELSADEGNVILSKGSTVGYLAQQQELSNDSSIYEEMLSVKQDIIDLDSKIRALELDMKHTSGNELNAMLNTYTRLMQEFELKNGYAYKSEVTGILKGLSFTEEEFDKPVSTLSGGQRTRLALGKLLLSKPDLILLDEPTNHLDMQSVAWLETYLLNYDGAVIVVAHDRYFLDKIVTKVIEIENTRARMYEGNYTEYAHKKALLRDAQLKQYLTQQREIKHHEEVITKLRSFNREKSIRRAESREKMLAKIERIDKPTDSEHIRFTLKPRITSGNDVLSVKGLSKSFDSLCLFEDIGFELKRGEKAAIIGNNGTGKTTLLKIITGLLKADAGEVRFGTNVSIGYFDQEHQVLDGEKTLFDELQDAYPYLDNTTVRNILAAFLFTEDDVFKRIKDISGGEQGRVSLAKLMLSEANLLILDEPTNHLDIASREILENVINNYEGTVLYVSHDRYFINKTATRILDLTDRTLINYLGNYDYYLEKKPHMEAVYLGSSGNSGAGTASALRPNASGTVRPGSNMVRSVSDSTQSGSVSSHSASGPGQPGTFPLRQGTGINQQDKESDASMPDSKLSWLMQKEEQARIRKRKNELQKTEDEIHRLEARSAEIDNLLVREDICTDAQRLLELHNEKSAIEERLIELLEQWEKLVE